MINKEHDIKKESASQEDSDWTEERKNEIFRIVKKAGRESKKNGLH